MTNAIDEAADEIALQVLPLDAWHRARGARMVPFAGYEMPIQYEGIMPEHLWTRGHAGLFDVSHMGQLVLTGDGVARALEALLPADVTGLADGRMRYSLLLDERGGILDDLMLTHRVTDRHGPNSEYYMVVNGTTKWDDIAHLREHLPDEVVLNHMDDQALLALQGPEAAAVLARAAPGVEALSFMTAGAFDLCGTRAWISRSGYTGEDGFEISIPSGWAIAVATALCAEPEVRPIGLGARDSLRLEAGLPLYGHDLDETTTPIAAGLGFALSKRRREDGGFPGHARLMLERGSGSVLTRVGLAIAGRQPVREGALVLDAQGNHIGRVTSGGFSPTLQTPIAMAYVPVASAAPGTAITLEQRGKLFTGTVTPLPFVAHRYHRTGARA